jgi:hypothetical protein
MVWPAKYPEYWAGTLEQNRTARKDVMTLMQIISEAEDCDMAKECCVTPAQITRVNPDGGVIEVSYDGGATWSNSPDTVQKYITIPEPPVTSGVAGTKCDAATNVQTQVQAWIDQVLTDFDTATALLDFALAVAEAVLAAVLTILSLGTLTVAQALVLPIIAAGATAAFAAGKVAFEDYWTPEALSAVLCAAYCCIADDGSFNEAQFKCFWNKCNTDLSPGPAKMLFMGFLSSVGASGLSAMAASGTNADADCADCVCFDDCASHFVIWDSLSNGAHGSIVERGDGYIIADAGDGGNGDWYLLLHTLDIDDCCVVPLIENITGSFSFTGWCECGETGSEGVPCHSGIFGDTVCINYIQLQDSNPFRVKLTFAACP